MGILIQEAMKSSSDKRHTAGHAFRQTDRIRGNIGEDSRVKSNGGSGQLAKKNVEDLWFARWEETSDSYLPAQNQESFMW